MKTTKGRRQWECAGRGAGWMGNVVLDRNLTVKQSPQNYRSTLRGGAWGGKGGVD